LPAVTVCEELSFADHACNMFTRRVTMKIER